MSPGGWSSTTRATAMSRGSPGWKHKFVPVETGTVDAFSVDDNEWRQQQDVRGRPEFGNAALWRKALKKSHISVAGRNLIERLR